MNDQPPLLPPPLPPALPLAPAARGSSSAVSYVLAGASFIPLFGVPFGLAAIVWGCVRRAWAMVILGLAGVAFTVVSYGALFYFGFYQHGGIYDDLRAKMAVTMLNSTVREGEFYKLRRGHYPATLDEVASRDINNPVFVVDPTSMNWQGGAKNTNFFYELAPDGKTYLLRSVGPDRAPFTDDDILPSLSEEDRKNIGLRLQR